MEKEELNYSIQTALRCEFDLSYKERMIQIYKTSKQLGFEEQAFEMKQDIEHDYNLIID
jgi:hypothetical protein